MELNKNIYFDDNLLLTITWNSATKFSFTTPVTATVANPATQFIVPTLSALYIYTACETDPTCISQLVSSVNEGFSMIVPFVKCRSMQQLKQKVHLYNKEYLKATVHHYLELTLAYL